MSILSDTATALYSTMTGGTALTSLLAGTTSIYNEAAPDGATFDYVVFNHQGGGAENQTSKDLENNVWLARGYSQTSAKAAAAIAAQVDALLHKKNITIGNASTFWCVREGNVTASQPGPDNKRIWIAGGLYRIRTTGG